MTNKIEKWLKNIITLALIILFLGYIYLAWLKLDKGQVALATSQKHVKSAAFPKLAFCATISNSTRGYKRHEEGGAIVVKVSLPLDHLGQLKHESKWKFKRISYEYLGIHVVCDEIIYSVNQELQLEIGNSHGATVLLDKTTLDTSAELLIMVMNNEEDFMIRSFTEDLYRFELTGYKMENGSGAIVSTRMVSLRTTNLTTIDRDDQPCYKEKPKNQTLHSCIWNEVLESHHCSVLSDTDTQLCEGNETMEFYKSLIAITAMPPKEVYQLTENRCKPNCERTTYQMSVGEAVHTMATKEQMFEVHKTPNMYTDEFYFYFPSPLVTVSEEFEVYDFLDWAADCGGMGGILLGLSIAAGYIWLAKSCKKVILNKK